MKKWLLATASLAALTPCVVQAACEDPPTGYATNPNERVIGTPDCEEGVDCPYEPTGLDWQDGELIDDLDTDDQIIMASKYDSIPGVVEVDGRMDVWGNYLDDIWVSEADGTNLRRITDAAYSYNHIIVSPDRKLIIANRYSKGNLTGDYDDKNENETQDAHEGIVDYLDFHEAVIIDIDNNRMTPIAFVSGTELDAGHGGMAVGAVDGSGNMPVYLASKSTTYSWRYEIYKVQLTKQASTSAPYTISDAVPITTNLLTKLGYTSPYGDTSTQWVSDTEVSKDGNYLAFLFIGPEMLNTGANHSTWKARIAYAKIDHANNRIDKAAIVSTGGVATGHNQSGQIWGDYDPDIAPGNGWVTFQRHNDNGAFEGGYFQNGDIIRVMTPFLPAHWASWTPDTYYANLSSADPSDDQCDSTNTVLHGIPSWSEGGGTCVIHSSWAVDCEECDAESHARIVNPWETNPSGEHPGYDVTGLDDKAVHHVQWIPSNLSSGVDLCPTDEE
ncbi:MAG: hypothetical protein H6923_07800 [Alphaproteobacteria bacterium]|nr:hypothetical protein [Alphaproteobacteria bacterium]